MSEFGKTVIVNSDLSSPEHPYYNSIREAAWALNSAKSGVDVDGGTIIIEGTCVINGNTDTIDQRTVQIPSNVTIIGRGNATVEVTGDVEAFMNYDQTNGNENIRISGLKFVVSPSSGTYTRNLILMKNLKKSVIEKLYIWADQEKSGVSAGAAIYLGAPYNGECSDNIVRQCIIENYGKTVGEGESATYNYGYGIYVATAQQYDPPREPLYHKCKRNKIVNNIVCYCSTNCYLYYAEDSVLEGNIFSHSQPEKYPVVHEDVQGHCGVLDSNTRFTVARANQLNHNCEHGIYSPGGYGTSYTANIAAWNNINGFKYNDSSSKQHHLYSTIFGNVAYHNGYAREKFGYNSGGSPFWNASGIAIAGSAEYNSITGNASFGNRGHALAMKIGEPLTGVHYIPDNNCIVGNMVADNSESPPLNILAAYTFSDTTTAYLKGIIVAHNLPDR